MVRLKTTNSNYGCEISLSATSFNSVKISCANKKIELTPKITALDLTSHPENGVILDTVMTLHNLDKDAHSEIIKELRTKDLLQDVEIGKKANISSIPTKTSDLVNDSNFATTSEIPSVGNGTLTITQNGDTLCTFSANQSGNTSVEIASDLDEIESGLSNKADINASNFTTTGTAHLAQLAMPSTRYTTLAIGASGATYTAPANGWFAYTSTSTGGANSWIYLKNETVHLIYFSEASTAGIVANGFVPASAGDIIYLGWFGGAAIADFKFIYAKGDA